MMQIPCSVYRSAYYAHRFYLNISFGTIQEMKSIEDEDLVVHLYITVIYYDVCRFIVRAQISYKISNEAAQASAI